MTASCRLGSLVGAKLLIFHLWGLPGSDELFEQNLQTLEDCLALTDQFGLELAVETIPCKRADPLINVRRAIEQDARCVVALDTEFLALHNQSDPIVGASAKRSVYQYSATIADLSAWGAHRQDIGR